MPILKRKTVKPGEKYNVREPRKYIDLNEYDMGVEATASGPMIRVAEVYRYEDVRKLSDIVYNGDILIIDYTSIANDDLTLRRIISELKSIARDVNGDVAGIGKNYLIVAPAGMRIARKKIKALS